MCVHIILNYLRRWPLSMSRMVRRTLSINECDTWSVSICFSCTYIWSSFWQQAPFLHCLRTHPVRGNSLSLGSNIAGDGSRMSPDGLSLWATPTTSILSVMFAQASWQIPPMVSFLYSSFPLWNGWYIYNHSPFGWFL
jgi:hypothetical protein